VPLTRRKIILRSDELYNGPFSRMMIFCASLTEIEFWWSKEILNRWRKTGFRYYAEITIFISNFLKNF